MTAASAGGCNVFLTGSCASGDARYTVGMHKNDTSLKPRILVADDSQDTADIYCFLLSAAGYRVARAYDGQTALALAKVTKPDIAVLNYQMPGLTGLDVLRELREAGSRTRVIITSGTEAFAELAERALKEGAEVCVRQPWPADRLLRMVSAVLEQPRSFRSRP
jgi:CheY-like chemotaxis protein